MKKLTIFSKKLVVIRIASPSLMIEPKAQMTMIKALHHPISNQLSPKKDGFSRRNLSHLSLLGTRDIWVSKIINSSSIQVMIRRTPRRLLI